MQERRLIHELEIRARDHPQELRVLAMRLPISLARSLAALEYNAGALEQFNEELGDLMGNLQNIARAAQRGDLSEMDESRVDAMTDATLAFLDHRIVTLGGQR